MQYTAKVLISIYTPIMMALVCVAIYITLSLYVSLFVWLIFFLIGYTVVNNSRVFYKNDKLLFVYLYLMVSVIGLLVLSDNIYNYGVHYGYGIDDKKYYESIRGFDFKNFESYGVYQLALYPVYSLMRYITSGYYTVLISDLLPFNWLITSLVVLLVKRLSIVLGIKKINNFLLVVPIIFSYNFIDSSVRLYRDVLLIFIVLLCIVYYENHKYIKSLFGLMAVGLMRGANAFIIILFVVYDQIVKKWSKRFVFIFTVILLLSLNTFAEKMIFYASQISNVKNKSVYSGYEYIEIRNSVVINNSFAKSQYLSKALDAGGLYYEVTKMLAMKFIPLTMYMPQKKINVEKDKFSLVRGEGVFLYELVKNVCILSWVLYFPYMLLGVYHSVKVWDVVVLPYVIIYFAVLILFSLYSVQPRHMMMGIVFYPIIALIGYNNKEKYKIGNMIYYHMLVLFVIIIWNLYRWC